MSSVYINAFTDFGFKRIFGSEPNKDLLLDFLNQLFAKDNKKIVNLSYLNNEQLGTGIDDRNAIFDLYCETAAGEKFIVEMQKVRQDYFKDRSVFYSTFPIRDQAQKGSWNFELKSVYTVGILGFVFADTADDKNYLHHEVKLMDINRKTVFYDKLTYIYLELPKFNKTEDELETDFDKWLYVLKNLHTFDKRPARLTNRIFKKLFEVAKIAAFSPKEQRAYEDSLKRLRDLNNVIATARREGEEEGEERGIKIGEERGIKIGEERGIKIGEERGIKIGEELAEKRSGERTARKMLAKNYDLAEIAELSGLSLEHVKKLAQQK